MRGDWGEELEAGARRGKIFQDFEEVLLVPSAPAGFWGL